MIGYLKNPAIINSKEFVLLHRQVQNAIWSSTSSHPTNSILQHISRPSPTGPEQHIAIAAAFMNVQSSGSITLRTSNASDPALVDPEFIHEDYDKRVAIEAIRDAMKFLKSPVLYKNHVSFTAWPDGDSDKDILVGVPRLKLYVH